MKRIMLLSLVLVTMSAGAADVYVCKGVDGVTSFQQEPCPKAAKYVAHGTYTAHLNDEPLPQQRQYTQADTAAPLPRTTQTQTGASIVQYPATQQRGGIGSSAYQRGEVQATQCTAPSGKTYYTTGGCQQRSVFMGMQDRDWHSDHVEGVPGAVMIGPDMAIDPETGNTIHLQHEPEQTPVYTHQTDPGTSVDPDQACAAARAYSQSHYSDDRAAARARDVCGKGRSLWDLKNGGGIPQRGSGE